MRTTTADLSLRLATGDARLRSRLSKPSALHHLLDQLHDCVDPAQVAAVAVSRASTWLPVTSWAVVVIDPAGECTVLAEEGVVPAMAGALRGIADLVVTAGQVVSSAELSSDGRIVGSVFSGSVFAMPLSCRGRCFGALIGFDHASSSRAPMLAASPLSALSRLVAPVASALDKTLLLKRVEALAVTDDLTGLYNSRYLRQAIHRETKRAARNNRPLSLLFIDLDGFKLINDTYGHVSGSQALAEAALVIRGSARETDVAARYGGDEFALVLPDTGCAGAMLVADRVCQRLAAHVFLVDRGLSVRLTASVGVATLPESAASADELFKAADSAMYTVKDRGKNGRQAAPARSVLL